jgi:hypothetical protein
MTAKTYAGPISWGTFANDEKHTLAQGTLADMLNMFKAAEEAALRITEHDLDYQLFGFGDAFNSNGVFRTLVEAMGLGDAIADMTGAEPGVDEVALSWPEIDLIREMFGILKKGDKSEEDEPEEGEGQNQIVVDESLNHDAAELVTIVGSNGAEVFYF